MVMFLLSFVKGSKSADGGKNLLADMDPGGPNPLADMDPQSISASGFGPRGPILGGSTSARTPVLSLAHFPSVQDHPDLIQSLNRRPN